MTDFLLELRSEEIPARMQDKARDDLARLFAAELAKAGLHTDAIVTFATPRRLALIARDLPDATAAVSEETKGPKTSAPPQALEGFLRKTGLTREQLVERDGVFFAVVERAGRATADVLAEAIPAVIGAFPWPKSMRWGEASRTTESLRWVRPLQGIVALFGEDVVPCEIAGVVAGAATVGHRFHHPGVITIGSASDYVEKLHACHVVVDQDERRALIRERASALAEAAGLALVEDEGLVAENAGLTEWPVPLLGRFDDAFLSVPPEVIQLTARVNQKYFVCRDREGKLANAFVCTANIDAVDGGAKIVEGNQKVLAARLSDAKFFYETDLKVPLEEQAAKLDRIVFHEKLGTVADKVDRVAKLARWLVEEGIVGGSSPSSATTTVVTPAQAGVSRDGAGQEPHETPAFAGATKEALADLAERAARLAKADLVTGMVGEFPELQGLMGGYYAAAQGEDPRVAAAIRDHYKPVGQGDDVPTDPVTVAVSLADKLDTLIQFFRVGDKPTGSKDPFALRRAALGVLQTIIANRLHLRLMPLFLWFSRKEETGRYDQPSLLEGPIEEAFVTRDLGNLETLSPRILSGNGLALIDFFADRLKVQQREAGVRHDLIDAVFALGGEDDLVRLLARVRALQAFVGTEDGANLLAGYKRAANILKKEGVPQSVTPAQAGVSGDGAGQEPREAPASAGATAGVDATSVATEPAEAALGAALDAAEPAAADAVAREDFEAAMAALATLRAPIDAFFEAVMVNDPDPAKRAARLDLLARVRKAVHTVADFSKIEG
ncbi:glycine--tRNA ligase subunit beta [Sphingomonas sp. NFR15]|uniref:glycine--tRNA ligase subunit beta n=1 Tax=Sphingomonas sp. NFR15 TaxID=1566282 RepID=UPI00088F84A8|nr:glycine--tRNA ligase subunit beta [Sphingomonas sp. NFR15]SDA11365.1 glycyl-tRNA synthetase beta chain [Sphingomonas sp. NFR15]